MTERAPAGAAFEAHLAEVNLSGARLGYLLSAVLMPAGFALDWVIVPDKLSAFLWIRGIASVFALVLLGISFLSWAERHPVLLGAGPPLICAGGIEAMILRLDGVVSPYYAGLNLCILAVGVLYTWHWRHALAVTGVIVGMWLMPAVPAMLNGSVPFRPLFNNLYFVTLTSLIAVASTVTRYHAAQREFAARTGLASTSRELAATLTRLQELDRVKNEFFANISHELRTPLTLILAPAEDVLSRGAGPHTTAVSTIHRNAQRLLRLIDDLLDLARLDAGGLRLVVSDVDLPAIAGRVVESARAAATARSIDLDLDAPRKIDGLFGDAHRLEIVLTNLVSNAVKFTPDGGRIRVRVQSEATGATVTVADTGPGIPKSALAHIFDRFYQVEGSARRRHGGAGIGLALARELCTLHDGTLGVESEVGKGSVFRLWLPYGRDHFRPSVVERRRVRIDEHPNRRQEDASTPSLLPELAPASVEDGAPDEPIRLERGRRPRILVAEDEEDLREFIRETLARDFDVITARDGAEALELVRSKAPDLVVTDVMMPEVSGTDLCRTIKHDPRLRALPVIMLTARTGAEAVLEGYRAGADDFVVKPFHTRVLIARVRAQLRIRALGLQLADQAQLATAGVLAAGIAHEVKNPLNAALNATRVLKTGKGKVPPEKLLTIIEQATQRIVDIVSALEDHVRPADGAGVTACNVRAGIESSLRLLEHKMDNLTIHKDFSTARQVLAPARELNQVFLNLLDNAARAATGNVWVRVEDIPDGVRVVVADDGPGVPAETAGLLFQPFYTTRPVGEGTGLGLYLCRRIIDDCGGTLVYEPRDGGGAAFAVELHTLEAAA